MELASKVLRVPGILSKVANPKAKFTAVLLKTTAKVLPIISVRLYY
jgi:hypothetical protein